MGSSPQLGRQLDALVAGTDVEARIARDPLRFVRRFTTVDDIEVAAILSASLAFGRVDLFGPVLDTIFARMVARGGPRRFIDGYSAADRFPTLRYRWVTPEDFDRFFRMLRDALAVYGRLSTIFAGASLVEALDTGVTRLRGFAPVRSRALWSLMPSPKDGSACKRLCMMARWLVRTEAPDLGVWTHLRPADLVIPLDTHVYRISRFVGLTDRGTAGWRTAEQITRALADFDPEDPTRFDFALAHLGISGTCAGFRVPEVCATCPLDPLCTARPRNVSPLARRTRL